MDNDKRFRNQDWDTDAVHQRIINEVEAASGPTPKKKHRKGKFNWKIYVAAVVLGSMLLAGLGWILANDLCALDKGNETYSVTIEEGDGVFAIAGKLKKAGLIQLKGFFVLFEIVTGAKNDIDPGTYELNTSMDYRSLVHNMYDPDARRRADGSGWNIYRNGGRIDTGIDAIEWAERCDALGAGEILLTSMDCDGTKAGYDLELTRTIAKHVSVPVIASGGAGTKEHFYEALTDGCADAALAASLFHYKELEIREVKEYLREKGVSVRM